RGRAAREPSRGRGACRRARRAVRPRLGRTRQSTVASRAGPRLSGSPVATSLHDIAIAISRSPRLTQERRPDPDSVRKCFAIFHLTTSATRSLSHWRAPAKAPLRAPRAPQGGVEDVDTDDAGVSPHRRVASLPGRPEIGVYGRL